MKTLYGFSIIFQFLCHERAKNIFYLFFLILLITIQNGCGYDITYDMTRSNVATCSHTHQFNVVVAHFTDNRPPEERIDTLRKEITDRRIGNYTYDENFSSPVDEAITILTTKHLMYSKVFSNIMSSTKTSEEIDNGYLDTLSAKGVDHVLTGRIDHFYGYYEQRIGKQLLYGLPLACLIGIPLTIASIEHETQVILGERFTTVKINPVIQGLATLGFLAGGSLGSYLESMERRDIEWRTNLSINLINTKNHEILWQDTINVQNSINSSMPGVNTDKRKYEVAVESLRIALNDLVKRLSMLSIKR